ncbi:MAG: LPS assembly lipoprotein LptE [Gallionella sp.]|nr:LPS assembly lipoprotein LptE [Gallionella sp.]
MVSKRWLVLISVLLLSACGFHLRGQANLPFNTVYLTAPDTNSLFVNELRQNLQANGLQVVDNAEQAGLIMDIVSEIPDKQILTLGGSGRVSEYQLRFRVSLRAHDNKKQDWIAATELMQFRNYTYDDTKILAKEAEENLLYQSMRKDMAQQIMRRLSHAKPLAE